MPKNVKYGRVFRINYDKKISPAHNFLYSEKLGLKAIESKQLEFFHLKSIIMVLKKFFKKQVKFNINISFCNPITKKSKQSRMGKGKGKRIGWAALVKKGEIIVEISGLKFIPDINLLNSLILVSNKLPIRCKFVRLIY